MAARSYQLALVAAAQRLSDVYADGVGVVKAEHDLPLRQVILSAAGAVAYIGSTALTTSTTYGIRVEIGAAGGDLPVSLGPFPTGPIKLSDLYAAGAGSTLHVLTIPF